MGLGGDAEEHLRGAGAPVAVAPAPAARAVPVLAAHTAVAPMAEPAAAVSIPYYSPTTNMNTLAVAALRGFPALTGPREEFPLTEEELKQVAKTARHRAPIRRAAALYKVLFFIGLAVATMLVAMYLLISTRYAALGARVQTQASSDYFMWVGIIGGLTALSLIAARAMDRCQIWAPIAMIVHFSGWLIYLGWQFISTLDRLGGPGGPSVVVMFFSLIPPATFLLMSVFALTHVRRFLRRPLWTVHLLVQSKL